MSAKKSVEFSLGGRVTVTVNLPSFAGSEVIMYTSILNTQQREIEEKYKGENGKVDPAKAVEMSMEMIVKAIKEWNFIKDGQPLEPSVEILQQMPMVDTMILQKSLTGHGMTYVDEEGVVRIKAVDPDDAKKK